MPQDTYIPGPGFEVYVQTGNTQALLSTHESLTEAANMAEYRSGKGETAYIVAVERRVVETILPRSEAA